ncbi:MAG: hypothetical protein SFU56_12055 [Capsulimonadales bacterium]|nr:hypothetical protein [Capsulimonadales bacterium]
MKRSSRVRALIALAVVPAASGLLAGCFSKAAAQYDNRVLNRLDEIERRLGVIERRLARIEARPAQVRTVPAGRWTKIRDNGAKIVLVDSQTGDVKFVNIDNGSVHSGHKP